jgi:hypothetical protein
LRKRRRRMPSPFTYGQLKMVLTELGFREKKQTNGVALEHKPSDTLFLFRPYDESDALQVAEVWFVSKQLEERGLLEPKAFEELLSKVPAG